MKALSPQTAALALAEFFAMDAHVVAEEVRRLGAAGFLAQGQTALLQPWLELNRKGVAAQRWLQMREDYDPSREIETMARQGIRCLTVGEEGYPTVLNDLDDPPLVLFWRGELPDPEQLHLAVVGSRQPDLYGRRLAAEVGQGLAEKGVGVISGGALGVDSLAHEGAMQAGGYTLAVLGQGLGHKLSHRQQQLMDQMVASGGGVLSEYSPATAPEAFRFPHRNRLISGLSQGVVVVQARSRSGTKITVRHALDQSREVFVFPGNIYSELSQGCHELIRDGARLVGSVQEVLMDSGVLSLSVTDGPLPPPPPLSGHKRTVYQRLELEPRHVDALCLDTGLSAQLVGTALVMLEMENLAQQTSPGFFMRLAAALPLEES